MKSRFFTDTQGLDDPGMPADQISVCLRLNRTAYEHVLRRAAVLHMTSGEYMDHLILADVLSACGTKGCTSADSPQPRFPPAPPGH